MKIRRPSHGERFLRISSRGQIVWKCIEPHVSRLRFSITRRTREGNTPREARPACRNIFQSLVEKREHLVAAASRPEKIGVRDQLAKTIGVRREPEEPVLLGHPLKGAGRMQNAFALDDLVVLLERFASNAIPSLVGLLVEIV